MKAIRTIFILIIFVSFVFGNAVIVEWKADPGTNKITLQWKTSEENNVQKFVIERSIDNKHFVDIGEVSPRGPGYLYKFVDENIGKVKGIFYYRLRIVDTNGSIQRTDVLQVIPNISSFTRTWGSIKALFR